MQLFTPRYVGLPALSRSTTATVHAPQSPSAQPCLLPVSPVDLRYSRRVVVVGVPETATVLPLSVKSNPMVQAESRAIVCARTSAPEAMCSVVANSSGLWLQPLRQGMKIIVVGLTRDMKSESW